MTRIARPLFLVLTVAVLLAACSGAAGPLAVQKVTFSTTEGGEAVTSFKPSDRIFYANVELNRIETGLKVKTVWTAVETSQGANVEVAQKEFSSLLANLIKAQVELPNDWPTGKYKLDIYLNGTLAKSAEFSVQ